MIDWFSLTNGALVVLGLAIILAALSHARYQATLTGQRWGAVLDGALYGRWLAGGGLLLCLGLWLQGDRSWGWAALALLFAAQLWLAQRQLRGLPLPDRALWQQWWSSGRPLIVGVALLGILLAMSYAVVIRPWMQPDEPRHFEVVMHVARLGKPVVSDSDLVLEWEQEIIQAMEEQSFWWYGYSLIGWDPNNLPQSFVEIWSQLYSRAFFQLPLYYMLSGALLHQWGESLPLATAVMRLRLFNVLLMGLSLWGVYRTARELFPQWPRLALYALALAALWPSHLAANAAVNNDPLTEALVIWSTFWAVRLLRRGLQLRTVLWLTGLIVLTLASKRSGFSVLVLLLALPLWAIRQQRTVKLWQRSLLVLASVAITAGALVAAYTVIRGTVRNWIPSWLLNALTTSEFWQNVIQAPWGASLQGLLRTFLGWFGWMRLPLPEPFYAVGTALVAVALLLLLLGYLQMFNPRLAGWQRQTLFLLLLLFLAQLTLTMGKDIVYGLYRDGSVPQARYIYPAISAFLLPLLLGAHTLGRGRQVRWLFPAVIAILLLFNVYVLLALLYPFYWL